MRKSHTPANYRIRVKGNLDDNWSDGFNEMEISSGGGETILSGQVVDQAALHGLLIRIRDLNLTCSQWNRLILIGRIRNNSVSGGLQCASSFGVAL
jgi:hypothetical protein